MSITVTDNGIGIRKEFLPHVFDRFLQGDAGAARQHGGLGLGLAIAKQLAELHGGTVSVNSEGEGKAACFVVRLPFKADAAGPEVLPATPGQAAVDLAGVHILLVEDEPSAREGTCALLESNGAQLHAVESAAAARAAYMLQRPDILVSDIGLPAEDGYTLLQQIRSLERERGSAPVPALALTAFAREVDRHRALEAGYNAHLAKPVDPESLLEQIAQLTGRSPH